MEKKKENIISLKELMKKKKKLRKYRIETYKPEKTFKIKKEDTYPYLYGTAFHLSKSHGITGIIFSGVLATSRYMIKAKKKLLRLLDEPRDNRIIIFRYKDDCEC